MQVPKIKRAYINVAIYLQLQTVSIHYLGRASRIIVRDHAYEKFIREHVTAKKENFQL